MPSATRCTLSPVLRTLGLALRTLGLLLIALVAAGSPGCSVLANMGYWIKGHNRPARWKGLEGKKVAVVCLDAASLGGPGGEAEALARAVTAALAQNVPKITMVRQSEIADWIDNQNQEVTSYADVGRGVKADLVVGIDLISFNIHEGQTLLRGKANVRVRVYDIAKNGEVVDEGEAQEICWPENGARHVTENEAMFKLRFIHTLANRIAREYYDYPVVDEYGIDAAHLAD
jgi:hypothetical protein